MENLKKLQECFLNVLDLKDASSLSTLSYGSILEWDSVAHMSLISEIEKQFDVLIEMDDVVNFNSFEGAKGILRKHNIEFEV